MVLRPTTLRKNVPSSGNAVARRTRRRARPSCKHDHADPGAAEIDPDG